MLIKAINGCWSELIYFINNVFWQYNQESNVLINWTFLTVANGIYQNTVYGLAAKLPFNYIGAVVLGSVSKEQIVNLHKGTISTLNYKYLLNLIEFERNDCGFDQHNVYCYGTKSTYCGNILFHYCLIRFVGLFWYLLCITTKRKSSIKELIFHVNIIT